MKTRFPLRGEKLSFLSALDWLIKRSGKLKVRNFDTEKRRVGLNTHEIETKLQDLPQREFTCDAICTKCISEDYRGWDRYRDLLRAERYTMMMRMHSCCQRGSLAV